MQTSRSKPWRPCCGYIVRVRPRADGLPCVIEVNPAAATVMLSDRAGEKLSVTSEKLLALAESVAQEGVPIVYRIWPHKDFNELVELYRAPSQGWQDRERGDDELF